MAKNSMTILMIVVVSVGLAFFAGCESDAQTGALIGTAIGAVAGQAIGGDTESTLIGAGAGAAGGYILGGESDKKKERARTAADINALRAEQNTVTVWITNSNGSKTPVTLTKSGPGYIGTKNDYYDAMPTEEQLRQVYGF